jgi:hypothetical protein
MARILGRKDHRKEVADRNASSDRMARSGGLGELTELGGLVWRGGGQIALDRLQEKYIGTWSNDPSSINVSKDRGRTGVAAETATNKTTWSTRRAGLLRARRCWR